MKLEKNMLIIDNRSIFVQSVKFLAKTGIKIKYSFNIQVSSTYQAAIEKLKYFSNHGINIDYIFLNIDIYDENSFGLILVKKYIKKIKIFNPKVRMVLFANRIGSYRLNYVIKECKPNGFILEKDIDFDEVIKIFDKIIKNNIYYSKSITSIFKSNKYINTKIDEINYHILYFLKIGIKSNYLQKYIPLSNSAIEKRKYKLKDEYSYSKCSDDQLIKEVMKRNIL